MEQTQFIGFVGQDASTTKNENGSYNLRITVAASKKYQNVKGEEVKKTTWYTVFKRYRNEPTGLLKHLVKGAKVFVQGEPNYSIKDYEGKKSIDILVTASELTPLTFQDS